MRRMEASKLLNFAQILREIERPSEILWRTLRQPSQTDQGKEVDGKACINGVVPWEEALRVLRQEFVL